MIEPFCADHSAHSLAIRQHDKRIESHGDEIDELKECVVRLTALQEAHTAWQKDADDRITALESVPARRWETVTNYALTAALAFCFGIVASHFGF